VGETVNHPVDKQGRSVRQVALLKWFVRKNYVNLPDEAINRYAVAIYDSLSELPGTRGTPRRSAEASPQRPPRSGLDTDAATTLDDRRSGHAG